MKQQTYNMNGVNFVLDGGKLHQWIDNLGDEIGDYIAVNIDNPSDRMKLSAIAGSVECFGDEDLPMDKGTYYIFKAVDMITINDKGERE